MQNKPKMVIFFEMVIQTTYYHVLDHLVELNLVQLFSKIGIQKFLFSSHDFISYLCKTMTIRTFCN